MTTEGSGGAAPRRTYGQRWLIDPVARQLTQGVTPKKVALTIAVGSALALFPIMGTTTTLCALAGILLGLNQPIIQSVNGLCIFIYFPLIAAFVRLGEILAGTSHASLDVPLMASLLMHHPVLFLHQFGSTALHAVVGWAVVAPFWVPAVYLAALPPLRLAAVRLRAREAAS